MNPMRIATADDVEVVAALRSHAFNVHGASLERAKAEFDPAMNRVLEDGGRVRATLRIWAIGHWFGGRVVPSAGIAGVAVAAEARGKGLGSQILVETLAEQRAAGIPISSLYPATAYMYRQAGYGYGGTRHTWTTSLGHLPSARDVDVEPFDSAAVVSRAYERFAAANNGLLARDEQWWAERVLQTWDDSPNYRYLVREAGEVTGYIVYSLVRQTDDWRSLISARDFVWLTPGAGRALLSLGSLHRSTASRMNWIGGATEPLANLLREDRIEDKGAFRWMLRLLDVPAAVEARGYNPLLETGVTIGVRDRLFADNAGPWRVEVSGGRAKVAPAGRAEAEADVEAWASIWSGHLSPADAVRTGVLTAGDDALRALELIFAGPPPWLGDFF
ncbi:MAG TPA: GNAT family N-acetyltransferase [Actinomycetota bacterium]